MGEHEPLFRTDDAEPPRPSVELNADEWDLIRESVDDYLRSYTEADCTWWEPDDERPSRLQALLDRLDTRREETRAAE